MTAGLGEAAHGEGVAPPDKHCADGWCVTCSDAAMTGSVLALLDHDLAVVVMAGREQEVSVALVTADVGDTVLVHAGEAIGVVRR